MSFSITLFALTFFVLIEALHLVKRKIYLHKYVFELLEVPTILDKNYNTKVPKNSEQLK